ncbi:MAG TPA: hypothetical protein ENJ29_10265 [Bacteroidetes bacterium]|nr:hypothetical protein [Bacteroidota bacterium]
MAALFQRNNIENTPACTGQVFLIDPEKNWQDMKGDILIIEAHHRRAARKISGEVITRIREINRRYILTVAGESGSGKSETAQALAEEFEKFGLTTVVLGQDDYFKLPPAANDRRRRQDPEWLGPHVEVHLDLLEEHLLAARKGAQSIVKPLIDYHAGTVEQETIPLVDVDIVIAEGTYTSLLKHVDTRVFIARTRVDTLEHRRKRNRGNEVDDPFIEQVLRTEHKIIAGHKQLADFVITKEYDVLTIE